MLLGWSLRIAQPYHEPCVRKWAWLVWSTASIRMDNLHAGTVPYLRVLRDDIFQQDNARPPVTRRVLAYPGTEGVRLLPWPVHSLDPLPIENFRLLELLRLGRHHYSATTIVNECHRLEAT
ncbi:hypothetical protein TNCV_1937451 [Trichonephila clavipes]|nr:hypothetical protein TNCV_1937451 [Trichonephila clavipes]